MNVKRYLRTVPTIDLIEELECRDLTKELGRKKAKYLKEEDIRELGPFSFIASSDKYPMPYSFRYLKEKSLKEIKKRRKSYVFKNIITKESNINTRFKKIKTSKL